ncbi:gamma-glutamylcyclotransferase [Veronia nyctiphanis]|uniref:Gamma-glutamylcyclotransferase n=1 Tax=Veronia nyctiphanis TaxID=1278244 RepID=A0A4Q0YVJ6_9GAMM|nr:gamma-glutamylcyclotransferase family protein [Veronia nyctiphanis]RXJ74244.1 gamma-glutamylcyclotransferase [Veronia nyctiphanis]
MSEEQIGCYVFGYGSLINSASRALTGQTSKAVPVYVEGLIRHWGYTGSPVMSHLVVEVGEGRCNGVLIGMSALTLNEFDIREKGYQRIKLSPDQIKTLDADTVIDQPVYVYVTSEISPPSSRYPIAKSYIDTVIAGCLEFGEEFASAFVDLTEGWRCPCADDRLSPLYSRVAGVDDQVMSRVDQILGSQLP